MAKTHKVRAFYPEISGDKPNQTLRRHYIHSKKSCGFWADIRDLSQKEVLSNDAVGKVVSVYITVGYNPLIVNRWEDLILQDENGKTYRIKAKPDEFNYGRRDIRIAAYAFTDNSTYLEDIYD